MPVELFLPIAVALAALVFIQYYRNRRMMGGFGWALLVFSIGAFGSGLAESFQWSGLVFLFLGALGAIAILQDIVFTRHAHRQRRSSVSSDLDRE